MVKPELETSSDREIYQGQTLIKTNEGNKYSYISVKDFNLLMDFYDVLRHPKLGNSNWRFVLNIDSRIYTEWCMSDSFKIHYYYQGEGFLDFIGDETHFELVRRGNQWNDEEKRFENLNHKDQYDEARKRVLGGLTLRAIELFSDWKKNCPSSRKEERDGKTVYVYDDQRNIRLDLNNYIIAFDSMRNFKI